jgi:hypothetical protein
VGILGAAYQGLADERTVSSCVLRTRRVEGHDVIARIEYFVLGAVAHQVQRMHQLVAGGVADLCQPMRGVVGVADEARAG